MRQIPGPHDIGSRLENLLASKSAIRERTRQMAVSIENCAMNDRRSPFYQQPPRKHAHRELQTFASGGATDAGRRWNFELQEIAGALIVPVTDGEVELEAGVYRVSASAMDTAGSCPRNP